MFYLCAPAGLWDTQDKELVAKAGKTVGILYKEINHEMQHFFATRLTNATFGYSLMNSISSSLVELLFNLSFIGSVHKADMTVPSIAFNAFKVGKRKGKIDLFAGETIVDLCLNADKSEYNYKSAAQFQRDIQLIIGALDSYSAIPLAKWQTFCTSIAKTKAPV
jgi:hypothetical protein